MKLPDEKIKKLMYCFDARTKEECRFFFSGRYGKRSYCSLFDCGLIDSGVGDDKFQLRVVNKCPECGGEKCK